MNEILQSAVIALLAAIGLWGCYVLAYTLRDIRTAPDPPRQLPRQETLEELNRSWHRARTELAIVNNERNRLALQAPEHRAANAHKKHALDDEASTLRLRIAFLERVLADAAVDLTEPQSRP